MEKKHAYKDAKETIQTICNAANAGEYDTREKFMAMVEQNPQVAVQGYNAFGKIFYWNEASVGLYGYREDEAINQDITELVIPLEMRQLARDAIARGRKTGKMQDPSPCDLVHSSGNYVTVLSGHLVFQWENASSPEFYCLDLGLDTDARNPDATTL